MLKIYRNSLISTTLSACLITLLLSSGFCSVVNAADGSYLDEADRAIELLELGEVDQGHSALTELLKSDAVATDVEAFKKVLGQLTIYIRAKKATDSLDFFEQFLLHDFSELEDAFKAHALMSLSYNNMALARFGHVQEMIEPHLERLTKWTPDTSFGLNSKANVVHIYGQMLVRQKKIAQALPFFFQAEDWFASMDPNHSSIFTIQLVVGEAYLAAGDYEKALSYIQKANVIFPVERKDGRSYLAALWASTLLNLNKGEEALDVLNNYLADPIDPRRDYFLYFSLIHLEVLRALEQFDEAGVLAQQTYELAQEIGNADYLNDAKQHLGILKAQKGDFEGAKILLIGVVDGSKDIREHANPSAYLDLIDVLKQLGEYEAALALHKKYFEVSMLIERNISKTHIANLEAVRALTASEKQQEQARFDLLLAQEKEKASTLILLVFVLAVILLGAILTAILLLFLKEKRQNKTLEQLSTQDHLTGLGNRRAFYQATDEKPYQLLLMADLDYLKFYNDEYGHNRGDDLIRTFTKTVLLALSGSDSKLFRIGGDEFIILTNDFDQAKISEIFRTSISQLQSLGFEQADASYGIAARDEADELAKQLSLADTRMYEMKTERKKNR